MSRPARSFAAAIAALHLQLEQLKAAVTDRGYIESYSHDWHQGRVHQCFEMLKRFNAVRDTECPCSNCVTTAGNDAAAERSMVKATPSMGYTGGLETFRKYRGTKDVRW